MKGVWKYAVAFVLGALLCGGIVLYLAHSAGTKLNTDLTDATDSADSLRSSLADAVAANHELASKLQSLSGQLDKSSKLLAADDARIAAGQRIIDGILGNIASAGVDLGRQIDAIADGFGRLYGLYHPNQRGPTKGSR